MPGSDPDDARPRWRWWARWVIGVGTAVGGVALAVLTAALGHCSAFGGSCPAEPEPLLQNDVFGTVAVTTALTVWIVGSCIRPTRRGSVAALLTGVPAGLIAGLAAVASTTG